MHNIRRATQKPFILSLERCHNTYREVRKTEVTTFDIIVLAIVGILTIIGLFDGMAKQLFGLAGIIGGYMLAMRYYQLCSKYLTSFHPGTAKAISFLAILLVCIVIAYIIRWVVGRYLADSGLGFLNRIGGGLLGFLKGYLIVSVIVMVLTAFLPASRIFFKGSHTIRYILSPHPC